MKLTKHSHPVASSGLRRAVGHALVAALVFSAACSGDRPSTDNDAGSVLGSDASAGEDSLSDAAQLSTDSSADAGDVLTDASTRSDAIDAAACVPSENDGGTCNAVPARGALVATACSGAEPPQAQGGPIENGTYELTAYTRYGTCPTPQDVGATTWVICGGHWDVGQLTYTQPDGGIALTQHLNFIASAQGTSITYATACAPPNFPALPPRGYSASPGRLTFIYADPTPGSNTVFVSEYTKH